MSEGRPHAEVRVESTRARGRLERAQVDVQFPGELIKWQEFVLSLVMSDRSRRRCSAAVDTTRRPLSHGR